MEGKKVEFYGQTHIIELQSPASFHHLTTHVFSRLNANIEFVGNAAKCTFASTLQNAFAALPKILTQRNKCTRYVVLLRITQGFKHHQQASIRSSQQLSRMEACIILLPLLFRHNTLLPRESIWLLHITGNEAPRTRHNAVVRLHALKVNVNILTRT